MKTCIPGMKAGPAHPLGIRTCRCPGGSAPPWRPGCDCNVLPGRGFLKFRAQNMRTGSPACFFGVTGKLRKRIPGFSRVTSAIPCFFKHTGRGDCSGINRPCSQARFFTEVIRCNTARYAITTQTIAKNPARDADIPSPQIPGVPGFPADLLPIIRTIRIP